MTHPYRLSVVMIVKNEAHSLQLSLPSVVEFADEIIILDSGSTDDSQAIAERYGAKWYVNADWPGFGKQRQIAQQYANGDWILALDADEVVTPQLKRSILNAIAQPPSSTIYGIKRLDYICGHCIDNPYWGVKAHWRLYPRSFGYDDRLVHESVIIEGAKTVQLDGFLQHHTAPSVYFWIYKRLEYAHAWAQDRHQIGKVGRGINVIFNPLWALVKQYLIDGRFLQGRYGLIYSLLFMQYTFNKYAILYDLTHNRAQSTFANSILLTQKLAPIVASHRVSRLSLVMIVKNEAKHLAACLDTVADIVDEIIILDSGSTDHTARIAAHYNAKWYVNTDWQGFGRQRQIAQRYASGDYILVLDADERLDQPLREAIVKLLQQPVQVDRVFSIARVNYFCGIEVQNRHWYTDKLARVYANAHFQYSDLEVHESLQTHGALVKKLPGYLAHMTNDNLHHFLAKNIRYSADWAHEKAHQRKTVTLFSSLMRSIFSFIREYLIRADLLGGTYGYILAVASMGYTFNKYLLLWHHNKTKP